MAQPPKNGFRFDFKGVNITSVADSLTPDKYASALNIRPYSPTGIRPRPGYAPLFSTGNNSPITDLQSYTAINTDNLPAFLMRDLAGNVWLGQSGNNTAQLVGNLAGPQGNGVSMLPWRPAQSPQTWLYMAAQNDYQKFSAPQNNNVTQYKVGIAEPQVPLQAAPVAPLFTNFTGNASNWNSSGTAAAANNNSIISETVAAVPLADPVRASRLSVPVSIPYYLTGSLINANNNAVTLEVQDVLPPVANCNITAIRYANNNTGNCQIVCGPLPIGQGPTSPTILGALRRGAIVNIGNNSSNENVLVLNATSGPNGTAVFECSTASTRAANDNIVGVQAIVVDGTISNGQSISQPDVEVLVGAAAGVVDTFVTSFAVDWVSGVQFDFSWAGLGIVINSIQYTIQTVVSPTSLLLTSSPGNQTNVNYSIPAAGGTGTISQTLSVNPFAEGLGGTGTFPTEDDYVRMVVLIQDISTFVSLQVIFVCATYGTFTYTLSDVTALADGELSIIEFPISALVPAAISTSSTTTATPLTNANFSLASCTEVQVSFTTTASRTFGIASLCLSGGGNPDIGNSGAPYQYQFVGRSTVTGAQSNPSPVMRYGVSPRRQNVTVPTPAVASAFPANDAQINIYDIYRYGGSLTSYLYAGSVAPGSTFTDMYFDDSLDVAQPVPSQNYEPWPSVDVPYSVAAGGGNTVVATGTQIVVSGPTSWPTTINRWLPGTLILLGGQTAYTLRKRPIQISASSYLFDVQEAIGSLSGLTMTVNEPIVARQFLLRVFGPDANGYMWGVGDQLRPGVGYFCTPNTPDATASTNTVEPINPSEPLLGGEILSGLSCIGSSNRWWSMFPAFDVSTGQVFEPFQLAVKRGLACPWTATDKTSCFFWAKDGIWSHARDAGESLTDDDLYQLFPHDDVQGQNITRNGVTFYAPDYSRASSFRLTWIYGYLYADYQDSTGTPRTLVCWLAAKAWMQDSYANSIIARCAMVQPEGTLQSSPNALYGLAVMADNAGNVYQPSLTAGDNGAGIPWNLGTFEWDGEPNRNSGLWEDWYCDVVPGSAITVTPVMFGQQAVPPTTIAASTSRILAQVPVPDGSLNRYLGLQFTGTELPGNQTRLYTWRNFADPDSVYGWNSRRLTFGLSGYLYAGRMEIVYSCTAVVTLNLTAFDGTSAQVMTIPATGGVTQKILVTPTANKGQLLDFSATSTEPFQLMGKDCLIWVRQWGNAGPWLKFPLAAEISVKP